MQSINIEKFKQIVVGIDKLPNFTDEQKKIAIIKAAIDFDVPIQDAESLAYEALIQDEHSKRGFTEKRKTKRKIDVYNKTLENDKHKSGNEIRERLRKKLAMQQKE